MTSNVVNRPADGSSVLSFNVPAIAVAATASVLLAAFLAGSYGWRHSALFLVGLGAGLVLYHAAFGFTSAWRMGSPQPAGRRRRTHTGRLHVVSA